MNADNLIGLSYNLQYVLIPLAFVKMRKRNKN